MSVEGHGRENLRAGLRVEYDQPWLMSLLRPTLIAIMVGCVGLVMSIFIMRFFSGVTQAIFFWALVLLTFFAAILATVTTTLLAQPSRRLQRTAAFRLSELALLLALTRFAVWTGGVGFPSLNLMLMRPMDALLDPVFIFSAFAVVVIWVVATDFTGDLNRLALQPDELYVAQQRSSRSVEIMRAAAIDRRAILRQIVAQWVFLGVLIIVLAALVRRDLNFGLNLSGVFAVVRQGVEPLVVVALVVYFLIGLLLISEAQLALLRARWTLNKTPASPTVARRWPFYVLLLVLAIGVAAAILPLGGTLLLSQVIIGALNVILFLVWWGYRLTLLLLFWLLSLFSGEEQPAPPISEPEPPPAQVQPPPLAADLIPDWLNGVVVWGVLAAIVVYAAVMYFRERGFQFTWLRWLITMLRLRWEELARFVQGQPLLRTVRSNRQEGFDRKRRLFPWQRAQWNTAEEQVRYYYLSTLHDAEEAGLPRRKSETPLVYEPRLEESMHAAPEEEAAVKELTEAFVAVRYAGVAPAPERLALLREKWRVVRRALQLRRDLPASAAENSAKPTNR